MTIVIAVSSEVLERDGLFLIGVGAVVIVVAQFIWGSPRGLDGTPMGVGRPAERLGWTLNVVGAALVAGGSILVLIGNWPSFWFYISMAAGLVLATAAGYSWTGRGKDSSSRLSGRALPFFAGVALVGALALIILELAVDPVRDWTADRPVLVGVVSAALLVAPVLYFVEEAVRRRQAAQWRTTAARAVETYIWTAGTFHDRFTVVYQPAAAERLGRPTNDYRDDMLELAVEHPDFFLPVVGSLARDEGNHVGQVTLAAVPAMALYPPLASYIDRFHACNDTLRQIADQCYAIEFLRHNLGGERDAAAQEGLRNAASKIVDLHFARQRMLADIRLDLEGIEGVNPPAISQAHDTLLDDAMRSS